MVLRGELPPTIEIEEHGVRYRIDVAAGQKTGFYLDQRLNRQHVGALAHDADLLTLVLDQPPIADPPWQRAP